jgi:hypothetical protein
VPVDGGDGGDGDGDGDGGGDGVGGVVGCWPVSAAGGAGGGAGLFSVDLDDPKRYPIIEPRSAVTASEFSFVATATIKIVGIIKVNPTI